MSSGSPLMVVRCSSPGAGGPLRLNRMHGGLLNGTLTGVIVTGNGGIMGAGVIGSHNVRVYGSVLT